MNIYVETNFVLELVFEQEQHRSCEQILTLCESGKSNLIVPAYCLVEPNEKLTRQKGNRNQLFNTLNPELNQLVRTQSYAAQVNSIRDTITSLLVKSHEEEKQRFVYWRDRLLSTAQVIPLTDEILKAAAQYESLRILESPQDALVYASVISNLRQNRLSNSCFLNKNSKDFDTPEIVNELKENHCRMITNFEGGYNFVQKQTQL